MVFLRFIMDKKLECKEKPIRIVTRTEMILDDVKRLIGINLEKVKGWLFGIKTQVIGGQIKIKNPMMVFL